MCASPQDSFRNITAPPANLHDYGTKLNEKSRKPNDAIRAILKKRAAAVL